MLLTQILFVWTSLWKKTTNWCLTLLTRFNDDQIYNLISSCENDNFWYQAIHKCIGWRNDGGKYKEPNLSSLVEIELNDDDDFLKIRETLTRIGIASKKDRTLYQSCHILHKRGKYYIVHFKELFALDGKHANLTINDVQRRNRITRLLADWGLITIVKEDSVADIAPLNQIKVLSYKLKNVEVAFSLRNVSIFSTCNLTIQIS